MDPPQRIEQKDKIDIGQIAEKVEVFLAQIGTETSDDGAVGEKCGDGSVCQKDGDRQ